MISFIFNRFSRFLYEIEVDSYSESNGVISFSCWHIVWLLSVKNIGACIIPGNDAANIVRINKKTTEKLTKSHKNVRSWLEWNFNTPSIGK